jgi:hypothetical protein
MFNTRRSIFLVTVLALLLGTAFAQDAGQYVILNAQYGNERNHVDVTARLQDLARRDRPFRISDESMAVDPDRGHAKMLRVFARGANGQERVFDFPDGSGFDGAQFRSFTRADWGDNTWSGGWNGRTDNYGGQYLILSAQYGNEYHHVDVTNQLKQMAQQDRIFRLNYQTFGVDPAEGQAKVLRIYAQTPNGQEQMFEYRDNSLIDGAVFQGWNNGQWGAGRWSGNWNGGGFVGGMNAGGDAGQYLILSAQYGNEYHHVDVTNRLKEMARSDRQFRLNYETFGVDPAEGQAKVLRIFAEGPNGQEQMFEYRDNSVIDGAQFRGWNNGQWSNRRWSGNWNPTANPAAIPGDQGQFVILSAQYGSQRRHVDVTRRLKELARTDQQYRLDFRTFGVDPDQGHAKVLRIFARGPNGRERMFEYRDGSVIDGAQFRGWGRGEWGNNANDRWSGRWDGEERHDRGREHDRD